MREIETGRDIGKALKAEYEAKGYTRADVAKYIGVDESDLKDFEEGSHSFCIRKIKAIADMVGLGICPTGLCEKVKVEF